MILHYAKENHLVRLGSLKISAIVSFVFRAFLNTDAFGCVVLFFSSNKKDLLEHL